MGQVYRARDDVLGRDVALKVLHERFAGDAGFVERFRREARAAAQLNHPNVVGVYDWGVTEGTYYMAMEYVPGHNLRTLLTEVGRLEPAQVAEVAVQVLAALDHAHGHGIVHRDVKPENILIAEDGTVKVADFGLARAFAASTTSQVEGTVTGTVQYLAPEQVEGEPADPRTDLYATGIVLFELLTGRPPYSGETSVAIAYRHVTDRVPPPSAAVPGISPALDSVVLHATEKDRERRPASARAMGDEVRAAAPALPPAPRVAEVARQIPPTEVLPLERSPTVTIPRAESRRRRRRRRTIRALTVLGLLIALAGGGWAVWTFAVPHYTAVPGDLVGLTPSRAQAEVRDAGLVPAIGLARNSTTVAKGLILLTQPGPGVRVERGSTVTLIPSAGPRIVPVPDVVGEASDAAQRALRGAGFVPKVRQDYSDTVPAGDVISQDPAAKTPVEEGQPVTIVVSKGPAPIVLQDYAGQQAASVEAALRDLGLQVHESKQYSQAVDAGNVIATDPAAGSTVHRGDDVTVIVSLGPKTFPMPNVVGQTKEQALALLRSLGLDPVAQQLPGSNGDTVVGQIPTRGVTVQQGQQVKIYVGG
jgi:serine/threonine-protein kinase